MMIPLLIVFLLKLKVHLKMKLMSYIVTQQCFLCYGSSAGKTMCTAPHPGLSIHHLITGKARGGINIKMHFLQGKPLTVLPSLICNRISPKMSTSDFISVDSNVESKTEGEYLIILIKTFLLYALILA